MFTKEGSEYMVNSNSRKLTLSGWLQEHNIESYNSPTRLQKFLFFYEMFSKVDGEEADFSWLKGYEHGPVFSTVYGDYTYERESFDAASFECFNKNKDAVNNDRAELSSFIGNVLTANELSSLTHNFNIWAAKKDKIMAGESQTPLEEKDIDTRDGYLLCELKDMFPIGMIMESEVYKFGNKRFVLKKSDFDKLTDEHFHALRDISLSNELSNPVYVELDENGVLCID